LKYLQSSAIEQPEILDSKPETRNQKPETRNQKPAHGDGVFGPPSMMNKGQQP